MLKVLATLIYVAIIVWLFYQDHRRRPQCSKALWIPVIWLFLLGSHPLSFWFGIHSGGTDLDGNSFDRLFYSGMIAVSCAIIFRRRLVLRQVISANKSIFLFYLLLALTILWADLPYVTLKRWLKETGGLFVILVILTEQHPTDAIEAVFHRCAYVLIPLSVIFIKYVPSMGRVMDHTGNPQYVGVTNQKNSLGEMVLAFCIVILWSMLRPNENGERKKLKELAWPSLIILMGFWLLYMSDSKTSIVCLAAASLILLSHKLTFLRARPRFSLGFFLGALPLFILLQNIPAISDPIFRMLGRNATLTNRTEIWHVVRDHPVNPLIGCGYLMYWDINRTVQVGQYESTLKTIHNGYLEIYLDAGYLGLAVLFFMLICLGARAAKAYLEDSDSGRLLLAVFVATLMFNLTESIYARRGPLWFTFLLVCIGGSSLFRDSLAEPLPEEEHMGQESLEVPVT